ncbi:putative holin-like toxin [Pontibacillus halophilus]|uniref:putative holin-like toxin n=1 Tax=Pontibacillus halophilus TaxID=516704 RepID=UPI0038B2E3D0
MFSLFVKNANIHSCYKENYGTICSIAFPYAKPSCRKGVNAITIYEALMLMIGFGSLIAAIMHKK